MEEIEMINNQYDNEHVCNLCGLRAIFHDEEGICIEETEEP
jgi:hypothetical protein